MRALSLKALSSLFYNPPQASFPRISSSVNCQLLARLCGNLESCLELCLYRVRGLEEEMRYAHDSFCHKGESSKSMEELQKKVKGTQRRERILPMRT